MRGRKRNPGTPDAPQMRIALIRRGDSQVIPKGSTILESADELILSAIEYQGISRLA